MNTSVMRRSENKANLVLARCLFYRSYRLEIDSKMCSATA